jgi:hypothetical protein
MSKLSRDYSKSEFSKHRAALREFESVCDKVEDLQQENDFLYADRELVAEERDAAVEQMNETVKEIRDLNSRTRYFGRYSKASRSMYAEEPHNEKQPKKLNAKFSDWAFKGLYAVVVAAVVLLACGITPELGNFAELWIEFICDPWKLSLVGIVLLGSYKILFKKH